MNTLLDDCRNIVRAVMRQVAKVLNKLTGGRLSPNLVTIAGLLMHVPIALLIAKGYLGEAAVLLVIFGLFDTLDGELARLQKRASSAGMLLDAVTDRMKEILLYAGIGFYFVERYLSTTEPPFMSDKINLEHLIVLTIFATGGSILVSYVKAKGETAVAKSGLAPNEINRLFQDGFMRFEVRMFALVIGLLFGMDGLVIAVTAIALLSWLTAFDRLIKISQKV